MSKLTFTANKSTEGMDQELTDKLNQLREWYFDARKRSGDLPIPRGRRKERGREYWEGYACAMFDAVDLVRNVLNEYGEISLVETFSPF